MQIRETDFYSIRALWKNELWPGRKDVEEYSWMKLGGGHYENFYDSDSKFWLAFDEGLEIGSISAHTLPDKKMIRMRGLWVRSQYRRRNIGSLLICKAINWALTKGAESIWAYPRLEAWPVYRKQGFVIQTAWVEDEKGIKHCYASKPL